MSKILVATDDMRIMVHVYPLADPTAPDDEDAEPLFVAQCLDDGCNWNSFIDDNSVHIYESAAINDAEVHLETEHERVS